MNDDVLFQGARAKRFRLYAGLSRTELADQAGVARDSIRRFEVGEFQPKPSVALKIARVLNVPIEDLYTPEKTEVSVA